MAKYLVNSFNLSIKNAYAWAGIPDAEVSKNAADETEFTMYDGQKITKGEIVYIAPYYNETHPLYRKGEYICN